MARSTKEARLDGFAGIARSVAQKSLRYVLKLDRTALPRQRMGGRVKRSLERPFTCDHTRVLDWTRSSGACKQAEIMNSRTDALLGELLALPPEERSELSVALIDSLEGDESDSVSPTKWKSDEEERDLDIGSVPQSRPADTVSPSI